MDNRQTELVRAAQFFKDKTQHLLAEDKGVQLELVVQSLARMSGGYGFKSIGIPAPTSSGAIVLASGADDVGKKIVSVFFATLNSLGLPVSPGNLDNESAAAHLQRLTLKEAEERLAPAFADHIRSTSLDHMSSALACVIAAALFISERREVLAPHKAAAVVAYGVVEGIKTVPFF